MVPRVGNPTGVLRCAPAKQSGSSTKQQQPDSYQPSDLPPVAIPAGWAQRVGSRMKHFCLPLVPSPVLSAVQAVVDVATGAQRHSHFEHQREFATELQAKAGFATASQRLLDPNGWRDLGPGPLAARFQLFCGENATPKGRSPVIGDHLRIKLPDPGPPVWVRIEEMEVSDSKARVVVRPSPELGGNSPQVIAHLFGQESTNEFVVKQEGTTVTTSVSGHNEVPNYSGNALQDLFAGARLAGAWMGAKKPQWNTFTRKLLDP